MDKNFFTLCALLLTLTLSGNANGKENLLAIDEYNKQLQSALSLYKQADYDKALPQLELFAQRGEKTAQYIVGTMYLNSQGTDQDLLKSYAWLSVATEQRTKSWTRPLKMLDSKLPENFLVQASDAAEKYKEMYGVQAQFLKCRNVKVIGSKQGSHKCKKSEVESGYYFVKTPDYLVAK